MNKALILFIALSLPCFGQYVGHVETATSAPTGACTPGNTVIDTTGGKLYTCVGGTWGAATIANASAAGGAINCAADPYDAPYTTGSTAPTVDAGPALRSCFAALGANGGQIILPAGHYAVKTGITDADGATVGINLAGLGGVDIECVGSSGNLQVVASRGCSIEVISGAPAGLILLETSSWNATTPYGGPRIRGISFVDNTATGGAGIAVKNTSNSDLQDLDFTGWSYAGLSAPSAPTVTATSGGSLGAGVTVYVVIAHLTGWGFSLASSQSSATTSGTCPGSGNCTITVTHPTNPGAPAIGWLTYAGLSNGGNYYLQNACCSATSYASNFTITSSPPSTGGQNQFLNTTQAYGIMMGGSFGVWTSGPGYSNQPMLLNSRSSFGRGFNAAPGSTSVQIVSGDYACGHYGDCNVISGGDYGQMMGTHFEGLSGFTTGDTMFHVDGVGGVQGWNISGNFEGQGGNVGIGLQCDNCAGNSINATFSQYATGLGVNAFSYDNMFVAREPNGGSNTTLLNDLGVDNTDFVIHGNSSTTNTLPSLNAPGLLVGGTKFTTNNGCTDGTNVGGATAGYFQVGSTSCTEVVTMGKSSTNGVNLTAAHGWSCTVVDITTLADVTNPHQTTSSATTATFVTGTVVSGDKIQFSCVGY